MIHWKTKQEMGEGYQFTQRDHSEVQYNSLLEVEPHEENTMRTNYLVRDWWNDKQILELRDYINSIIEERK
tara:strand:+ start:948 stop:1160 length:213 start_codon:yes stop_codon:yes gene_type:complete